MHLPTLRQLEFLCAIADEGSFSRAADVCHVTQPTLSSAIKEIEGLLGLQLVERESRGASLTRAGAEAVDRARTILADAADLVSASRQAGKPLSGSFRLGAIPTIAPFLLPETLSALRAAYPELKLYLREDQTDRLMDGLRTRKLDAALIALPWHAPGIETQALSDDEFLLVAPTGHALLSKQALGASDLADQDVLLLEDGHCLRDHALSVCRLPAKRRGTDVTATSLQTLVHMVAGGLGVSLIPRLAANAGVTAGADVALRAFDTPMIGRQIGIAWRAGSPRAAEAQIVGEVVRAALSA
ncbi:MAG: hydrogen peroxide-inducible genes activator [Henriciella sp.]|nr:hydrogen peroxide-inducible genes activator [Henriciella sp.]